MKKIIWALFLLCPALMAQAEVKIIPQSSPSSPRPDGQKGPIWDVKTNRLYWIDMRDKTFHISSMGDGKDESFPLPEQPGTII